MPEIRSKADREARERLARWEAFQGSFRRNGRGNLTASIEGATMTVFPRGGTYHYCIAGGGQRPRFSEREFEDEEEALFSLWVEFEGI